VSRWVQSLLTTDLCLVRSAVRLRAYERAGDLRSAAIERGVIDRLLDQRNRIKRGEPA
jgi:hypothetical protein